MEKCNYCEEQIHGWAYYDDWEYNVLCVNCKDGLREHDDQFKDENSI